MNSARERRYTVLIVEDDPDAAAIASDLISRHSTFEVQLAANFTSALQFIDDNDVDCVLLDLGLPGLDMQDVMEGQSIAVMRETLDEQRPLIPIIVVTAWQARELGQLATDRSIIQAFVQKGTPDVRRLDQIVMRYVWRAEGMRDVLDKLRAGMTPAAAAQQEVEPESHVAQVPRG